MQLNSKGQKMSISYMVKGHPIKVSDLLKIQDTVVGFQIETQSSSDEFKPTTISQLSQRECYTLRIKFNSGTDDTTNYFWVNVDFDHAVTCFFRSGHNNVANIISLIEYHCKTMLIDEYELMELENIKIQNTINLVYQTEPEKLKGKKFAKSLGREVKFLKLNQDDFGDERVFETLDFCMTTGTNYWFDAISKFGPKTKILSSFTEYFGEDGVNDITVYEGNKKIELRLDQTV